MSHEKSITGYGDNIAENATILALQLCLRWTLILIEAYLQDLSSLYTFLQHPVMNIIDTFDPPMCINSYMLHCVGWITFHSD